MTRLYIQKLQTYFQIKGGEKRTAEIMNVFKTNSHNLRVALQNKVVLTE